MTCFDELVRFREDPGESPCHRMTSTVNAISRPASSTLGSNPLPVALQVIHRIQLGETQTMEPDSLLADRDLIDDPGGRHGVYRLMVA